MEKCHECYTKEKSAQLTGIDIDNMRSEMNPCLIIAPYNKKNSKGCGYNLTATEFVYSISKKALLPLHQSKQGDAYVKVNAHDTVLLLTREYIKLNETLAGSIYSRVQLVSNGFGHISTTIDPGWKGMLLLSINNPTKKAIKLLISESSEGTPSYKGIATMVLTPVSTTGDKKHAVDPSLDNPAMRLDILKKLVFEPKRFFADKKYQDLKQLVLTLENFSPVESEKIHHLHEIRDLLVALECEINSYMDIFEIEGYLTKLKRADYDEFDSLQKKIFDLFCLENISLQVDPILKEKMLDSIESGYRECEYLILNEQVNQIHQIIKERTPYAWKHLKIRNFIYFIRRYWKIFILYAVFVIGMTLLYQKAGSLFNNIGFTTLITSIATIAPPLIAYLIERSDPTSKTSE